MMAIERKGIIHLLLDDADNASIYIVESLANAFDLTMVVCLIGSFVFRFWVLPSAAFSMTFIMKAWKRYFLICLSLFSFSSVAIFILRSLSMNDGEFNNPYALFSTVLFETHLGHLIFIRFILLACLWAGQVLVAKTDEVRVNSTHSVTFGLICLLGLTCTLISHAADKGDFTFKVLNDFIHILAAGGWGGSVFACVFCLFPWYRTFTEKPASLAELGNRLSIVCAISLLIILLTGVYQASWFLGKISDLWTSPAGGLLCIKLSFIVALIFLGGINKFMLIPRINQWALQNKPTFAVLMLKITLLIDIFIFLIVLILTGFLIHAMPPMMP